MTLPRGQTDFFPFTG